MLMKPLASHLENNSKASKVVYNLLLFLKKDFIYLFVRDTHTQRGRDIGRRRSRLPNRELDAGLDLRAPGS